MLLTGVALAALIAGYLLRGAPPGTEGGASGSRGPGTEAAAELYTCSMHPQIRQDAPGSCPICGMDLVPVQSDAAPGSQGLWLDDEAAALARIRTSPVERRPATVDLRLVGTIAYDETRVRRVSAWLPGRIDRLYIDYTGVSVRAGDHVGELYGPELLTSQQELIDAARAVRRTKDGSPTLHASARATQEAVRERFRLWGFTKEQIRAIERQGRASDHMTLYSPIAGVVIERAVDEGAYVREGDPIVRIADLSNLWLVMAAYESDLPWLRYGQAVEFSVAALPGERFEGRVAFVSPVLDPATRTAPVRVNVDNTDGRLKPEMFARARVHVQVRDDGQVIEPSLEGKWIGPMHPGVVRDEPGTCPICGMDLVPAEQLGYESAGDSPLLVPSTAPLITGERALVYVAHAGERGARYEAREVTLGPRAGSDYVVLAGLHAGEHVVTHGTFKVDSSQQILARPSMMDRAAGGSAGAHQHHPGGPAAAHQPTGADGSSEDPGAHARGAH